VIIPWPIATRYTDLPRRNRMVIIMTNVIITI
jgi:hypothetical protein